MPLLLTHVANLILLSGSSYFTYYFDCFVDQYAITNHFFASLLTNTNLHFDTVELFHL